MNPQYSQYPEDDDTPGYAPIGWRPDSKADLLEKINPDQIVETIRHKLMGEEEINGKWEKNDLLKEKAISPEGAWQIANLMLSVSSKNVSLSNLKDHEIKARTMGVVRTVQYLLLKNWKKWKIKGIDQLEFVNQIILSNTFITLKQPENHGIINLLKGNIQEIHSFSTQPKQQGWIGKLLGRKQ